MVSWNSKHDTLQIPTSFYSSIRKHSSIWISPVFKIFCSHFFWDMYTEHIFFSNKVSINYILELVPLWKVKTNTQCRYSSQLWKVNMKTRHCHTSRWWGQEHTSAQETGLKKGESRGRGQCQTLHFLLHACYAQDLIRLAEMPSKSSKTTTGLCIFGKSNNPRFCYQSAGLVT